MARRRSATALDYWREEIPDELRTPQYVEDWATPEDLTPGGEPQDMAAFRHLVAFYDWLDDNEVPEHLCDALTPALARLPWRKQMEG